MSSWADRPGRSRRQVPLAPDGARSASSAGPSHPCPQSHQPPCHATRRLGSPARQCPRYELSALGSAGGGPPHCLRRHVFVAHFAVGGGLFLVWTERKARRENDAALLDYVRRHSRFFILL